MSDADRARWDDRYSARAPGPDVVGPPEVFAGHTDAFPVSGNALDLACGQGIGSVWLARRGLRVLGVDVSMVAVEQARILAARNGVGRLCRFEVADLDEGLPPGPDVDVVLCHRFRDRRLDRAIVKRLKPGALLAICVLSEVGAGPGPFRAAPGELRRAFDDLDCLAAGEGDGQAWLLAVRPAV